jgi:hypothetical protein
MAAVQVDLLVLPPTAGHIAARGDRHLGRLAKECGVMRVPVMAVGTVGAMRKSRGTMGREPMDRARTAVLREVSRRVALRVRISSHGLRVMIFRRARQVRVPLDGYQYPRSASQATTRLVIHPTRPKARSGCMVIMQSPPHCRTPRAGCAGYL